MLTIRSVFTGLFILLAASSAWAAPCAGFTDVDNASGFCAAVTYIKDHGITVGCTGTTYCPNDYVTRLQMAAFLQRAGQADPSNTLGDHTTSIGGGTSNKAIGSSAVVGGGDLNWAEGQRSSVLGGYGNASTGYAATVAGGTSNSASGSSSIVAGGTTNQALGEDATVGGGQLNKASGVASAVIGGTQNVASGLNAAVLGGAGNSAAGELSVALGHLAETTTGGKGSFVFADATGTTLYGSGNANEFLVAASGGIRMNTAKDYTTGCRIPAGGGAWSCSSSRDIKRDFSPVDASEILEKVAALPVMRWRYQDEAANVRHIGTFSQEFRAAFGLGDDDQSISTIDADGVAMAAIQALNAKLNARDTLITEQARQIERLEARLDALADRGQIHAQ